MMRRRADRSSGRSALERAKRSFTLDFMPVLFVLIAIGLRREAERGRARLWHGAVAYAALLNALVFVLLPALRLNGI